MIPHLTINGTAIFQAMGEQGTVVGFIGIAPDGSLKFRGGTPWAPVDMPDAIEVIGAHMRQQVELQRED
jgi:hypothetical protein